MNAANEVLMKYIKELGEKDYPPGIIEPVKRDRKPHTFTYAGAIYLLDCGGWFGPYRMWEIKRCIPSGEKLQPMRRREIFGLLCSLLKPLFVGKLPKVYGTEDET